MTKARIMGIAALVLVAVVAGLVAIKRHRDGNRPRLVFEKPPEVIGAISCNPADGTIEIRDARWSLVNGGSEAAVESSPLLTNIWARPARAKKKRSEVAAFEINPGSCLDNPENVQAGALIPVGGRNSVSVPLRGRLAATALGSKYLVYATGCQFYQSESGRRFGTCNTYRLESADGGREFECDAAIVGHFAPDVVGNCAN